MCKMQLKKSSKKKGNLKNKLCAHIGGECVVTEFEDAGNLPTNRKSGREKGD